MRRLLNYAYRIVGFPFVVIGFYIFDIPSRIETGLTWARLLRNIASNMTIQSYIGIVVILIGLFLLVRTRAKEKVPSDPLVTQPESLIVEELPASPVIEEQAISPSGGDSNRVFTLRTPAEVLEEFNDRTDLQAARSTKRYVGKWITVDGIIKGVSELPRAGLIAVLIGVTPKSYETIRLYFDSKRWQQHLDTAEEEDIIVAQGKIEQVKRFGIELEDCELTSLTRKSSAPSP